jgi:hypothetical protein
MINASWLLYQGNNYPKSQNDYRLSEGDIIKIGRIVIIIREIKIKKKTNKNSITNDFSEDYSLLHKINIMDNENIKLNTLEYKNNEIYKSLNLKKINTLDYHKLVNQKEKELEPEKLLLRKIRKIDDNQISNTNTMSITITPLEDIKEKEIKNIQINKNKMINPQIQKSINIKPLNKRNKLCRICYLEEENKYENPLIQPCSCTGSLKYIHLNCLLHWLSAKILIKKTFFSKDEYFKVFTINKIECEICKEKLPDFIMHEGKIYSLIDFDQHKEIEGNYITFDAYSADKKQNRFRYIIKFDNNNSLLIGRGIEANIVLNDISISRLHCKLKINDNGEVYLSDLNSKFGTLVLIQNPNLEILKGNVLTVQIGRSFFCFEYKKNFSLFSCCDVDEINTKWNYEKLNRKYVYLHTFSNIKEEKNDVDDDNDTENDCDINDIKSDAYLKVIDEEDNNNKNNENDLTLQIQGDITSRNGNCKNEVNNIIIRKNENNKENEKCINLNNSDNIYSEVVNNENNN